VIRRSLAAAIILAAAATAAGAGVTAPTPPSAPIAIQVSLPGDTADLSPAIRIVALLTVLALAPAILMMTTCFVRVLIVFQFLRTAIGATQVPNNQVLLGLSLSLTFFIMSPVGARVYADAYQPYQRHEISLEEAAARAEAPLKAFMLGNVHEKDLALFARIAEIPRPEKPQEIPFRVVAPAFLLSELRTAFQMGFLIFLPFLVVDLVVSSVLLSMGMLMLPPTFISLPFKILLFVLADGWTLVVGALVKSFHGVSP
jgi:flagellar biosynthetic protein FliP